MARSAKPAGSPNPIQRSPAEMAAHQRRTVVATPSEHEAIVSLASKLKRKVNIRIITDVAKNPIYKIVNFEGIHYITE